MMSFRPSRIYDHEPRVLLVALLMDYFLAALLYGILVPAFEMPDEHTHYFFAQHLAHTGELPVQTADPSDRGPWEQEGSQPPLYYYMAAPLISLANANLKEEDLHFNHQNSMGSPEIRGNENRFLHDPEVEGWPWQGHILALHLGRILSSLMGLVTLICVWVIARHVIKNRIWLALAATGLVAFNPQFLALSAAFSNDNAIVMLSALSLALFLELWAGGDEGRLLPILAITVGLAPLAKLSGLALLAFIGLSVAVLSWSKKGWKGAIVSSLPIAVSALVLSAWWYWRNIQLYSDFTGLSYMLPAHTGRAFELGTWLRFEAIGELVGTWYSSWGLFGWFTILMPKWYYALFSIASILAVFSLAHFWIRRPKAMHAWVHRPYLLWLLAWAGLVSVSLLRWLAISKGGQGRLLFPAISALALVLIIGWRNLWHPKEFGQGLNPKEDLDGTVQAMALADRRDAKMAGWLILSMYAFAAYALLFVIRPAFAGARTIQEDRIPERATQVDASFGEGLQLIAADLPERVVEGETFPVRLYWRAVEPIKGDGFVALRMDQQILAEGVETREVSETRSWEARSSDVHLQYPGQGNTPPSFFEIARETEGDSSKSLVYEDLHHFTAPELAFDSAGEESPIWARLALHLYDQSNSKRWPAFDQDEEPLEGNELGLRLVLEPRDKAQRNTEGLNVDPDGTLAAFGDRIEVRGLEIESTKLQLEAGSERIDFLTFYAQRNLERNYSLFVHLLDAETLETLETFDQSPAAFTEYPSRFWRAGDIVPSQFRWEIPENAKPGDTMHLVIGLYDQESGERLALTSGNLGQPLEDLRAIFLYKIEIIP